MTESITHSASKIFLSSALYTTASSNIIKISDNRMVFKVQPFILHNDDPSHFVLGLEQFSCGLSFYVFTTKNNVLKITSSTYGVLTLTIPIGNYAIQDILNTLNALQLTKLVFTYNQNSNLLTVTSQTGGDTLTVTSASSYLQLGCVIGQTGTTSITFTNCVNLTLTTGIILRLNGINTNNKDSTSSGSSIIARIPIVTQPFTFLQYFNPVVFYLTLSNRVITQFDIELLDDNYNAIEFTMIPNWFVVLKMNYIEKDALAIPDTKIQSLRKNVFIPPPVTEQISTQSNPLATKK